MSGQAGESRGRGPLTRHTSGDPRGSAGMARRQSWRAALSPGGNSAWPHPPGSCRHHGGTRPGAPGAGPAASLALVRWWRSAMLLHAPCGGCGDPAHACELVADPRLDHWSLPWERSGRVPGTRVRHRPRGGAWRALGPTPPASATGLARVVLVGRPPTRPEDVRSTARPLRVLASCVGDGPPLSTS